MSISSRIFNGFKRKFQDELGSHVAALFQLNFSFSKNLEQTSTSVMVWFSLFVTFESAKFLYENQVFKYFKRQINFHVHALILKTLRIKQNENHRIKLISEVKVQTS